MKRKIQLLVLCLFSLQSFANGELQSLKVDGNIVLFSLSGGKEMTSPDCVQSGNENLWSLSLDSASGKAMYSLLVAASAGENTITPSSALDCEAINGVERVRSLSSSPSDNVGAPLGEFVPEFFSGALLSERYKEGVIFEISPPAGQRVRLTHLGSTISNGGEPGISVFVGGREVVKNLTLASDDVIKPGRFMVKNTGRHYRYTDFGSITHIDGRLGETIQIVKNQGKSLAVIQYSYAFGY